MYKVIRGKKVTAPGKNGIYGAVDEEKSVNLDDAVDYVNKIGGEIVGVLFYEDPYTFALLVKVSNVLEK